MAENKRRSLLLSLRERRHVSGSCSSAQFVIISIDNLGIYFAIAQKEFAAGVFGLQIWTTTRPEVVSERVGPLA